MIRIYRSTKRLKMEGDRGSFKLGAALQQTIVNSPAKKLHDYYIAIGDVMIPKILQLCAMKFHFIYIQR